jgi:hypothetical protein
MPLSPETPHANESTPILHLHLEYVLPDGFVLAIHRDLGFVATMTCDKQQPQMKAAQQFSSYEMMLLVPILLSYPHFCHYETLFASFSGGTTEAEVEQAHRLLSRAKERGEWGCGHAFCQKYAIPRSSQASSPGHDNPIPV